MCFDADGSLLSTHFVDVRGTYVSVGIKIKDIEYVHPESLIYVDDQKDSR